jgi:hypothetical protein
VLSVTTPGFDKCCLIPILSVNVTPHHPTSLATAACRGIAPFPTLEEQEEPPPQSGGNASASSKRIIAALGRVVSGKLLSRRTREVDASVRFPYGWDK